jgi:hypothetical protein
MQVQRKFVISLLLLVFLFTAACTKKKPPLPPQAQAPTIAEALPEEIAETPEPALPPAQAKEQPPPVAKKPAKKPPKATTTAKKSNPPATTASATPPPAPASTPPPQQQNNQTVASVRPHTASGSESAAPAPELAVAAAIPSKEANKQKEDTAHMVDATENVLKNLTRQLSDDEKSMRTQIQSYIQQSRKATTDGDYERAYNLAKKAQVLADALVKQ